MKFFASLWNALCLQELHRWSMLLFHHQPFNILCTQLSPRQNVWLSEETATQSPSTAQREEQFKFRPMKLTIDFWPRELEGRNCVVLSPSIHANSFQQPAEARRDLLKCRWVWSQTVYSLMHSTSHQNVQEASSRGHGPSDEVHVLGQDSEGQELWKV